MLSTKLKSSEVNIMSMDSFQDGGQQHMNSEPNIYHQQGMEGSYINQDMNNYGPNSGEPDMGIDSYSRMNEGMHSGHMLQYNSYHRGSDYTSQNSGYGPYQQPGSRESFQGMSHQSVRSVRPVMSSHMGGGMAPGPGGYFASQQKMMPGQSISPPVGPTPTLNQLLQTPNSQGRFQNNYDGYGSPQKGADMGSSNGPYGIPQGWSMQNQRGMGSYSHVPITGSAAYRPQSQQNYIQQGYSQQPNPQLQYSSQSSQPLGQPLGSSPQQQRPTPQPSPHQQISPVASPAPAHRAPPNPSPGPSRPQPQLSPGQQRSSQLSPSPSHKSSSQLSPPGSSPGHHNSLLNVQHNHLSSPKDPPISGEDVKGESNPMSNPSRLEPSPGSVGSRSNTPASVSGASPIPPPPSSQQDGAQCSSHMSHSPMPAPGYNQQMMPPPMGPGGQMGGYSQAGKLGSGAYNPHYQNTPYTQTGNYGMRQPGPGMGNYPQNMYSGPSQTGHGGQPMYNNMGDPGMNRSSYNSNMYSGPGNMMVMNNQYVSYNGPGQSAQHGPGTSMSSPGPIVNGPHGSINSMGTNGSGSNGPVTGPTSAQNQGQVPMKGAQAAAQAAMANACSQAGHVRSNANPIRSESLSPLSHMGQMNQLGHISSNLNDMSPHPQNSLSPGPNTMVHKPPVSSGKMHNNASVRYNSEQPKTSSKSKSAKNPSNKSVILSESRNRNSIPSPHVGMTGQFSDELNMPHQASTPTSFSDTGSQSNDSSSMGPILNNSNSTPTSGHMYENSTHRDILEIPPSTSNIDSGQPAYKDSDYNKQQTITTTHNSNTDITTLISKSITSPVTSLSTQDGNSNDSQQIPMEPLSALKNCNPIQSIEDAGEPPEKKKKMDVSQTSFARVAPSPDGVSVTSSGTHEDIDNIGSPTGFTGISKSSGGDFWKLLEMGMEPGRRPFLDRLFAFLEDKGTPISNMPVISKQPIDLYRLYVIVQEKGGMIEVTKAKKWKEICGLINVSGSASAAFTLKKNYIKFLFAHECYFDRGGMDPAPVLAQMENDLEKKRAAKQRNRAPSPAGSQGSQDGMPNQYMQNDPSMGHMGQGMMGNHIMNNMGPHGGPMMGQNMAGPHHMGPGMQGPGMQGPGMQGPGMQGPGHMMGSMGHQNYPGNTGYMMQGGPSNMMGGNMAPQSGMMGQVMQAPSGMMGTMVPGSQPGNMTAHNSMNSQHGIMNNMNLPPNSMMSHNNMLPSGNMGHAPGGMMPSGSMGHPPGGMMPTGSMGHPPGGMMPSGNMGHAQSRMMSHSNMNPQMILPASSHPPNGGPMMASNSMMRGSSDSVSCQDPFADEPYQKGNTGQGQMQLFSGTQQSLGIPQSASPTPHSGGSMAPANGPISSQNGCIPQNSSSLPMPQNSSLPMPQNSSSLPMPQNSSSIPMLQNNSGMPPQIPHPQLNTDMPSNNSRMTPLNTSEMQNLGAVMQLNPGMPPHSLSAADSTQAMSSPCLLPTSSPSVNQPNLFSQDSNSNSSLPETTGPMEPQLYSSNQMTSMSSQSMSQGMMPSDVQVNNASQFSTSANAPGRLFPFGDNQFTKPERFDQHSQNMPQPSNPQISQPPIINQSSVGPYSQQPTGVSQGPYMNPQQQSQMGPAYGPRYGNQMPAVLDQYNQSYSGVASQQAGYASRLPIMGPQGDQYPSYPDQGQYGKPMANGNMPGNVYTTPNKRFSDNRPDFYMSPAYGKQCYSGSSMMNYCDPNASHYQSLSQPYCDYTDSGLNAADRTNQNQWPPIPSQRNYHSMPQYGPAPMPGMSPNVPQSMSRMRMSPNKNRDFSGSPNNKQRSHTSGMPGPCKKEMNFPLGAVESTQPLMNKRRKLTKHDVGQIEAWRLMMSLKSGLMAESTWALDALNILLYDDATVAYFGLARLPGLLEVLLDHFRRCLIEMFDLFEDSQIGSGHEDFKQNLIRMAILESAKESKDSLITDEMREISRVNKSIVKIENAISCDIKNQPSNDKLNDDEKVNNFNTESVKDVKSRHNFTFITKQGKEVHVEENSSPNGLLDDKFWDVYGEFSDQFDLWECGKGDLTEHIFTHMEDTNEFKRSSQKFFRKPMKLKGVKTEIISESARENTSDQEVNSSEKIKIKLKRDESETHNSSLVNSKESDSETHSNSDRVSEKEKCKTSIDNTDFGSDKSSSEKDHTCNKFLKGVAIKSEQRDLMYDKPDSSDSMNTEENVETKSFRGNEPRMNLAVKYELLNGDELVQICKTQFGLNSEGERNCIEDESYQRNEPPLCLTTEAQHEISRRCICLSNIFRSLSCIPGNDLDLSRHSGLMYILGKLLLLHHKHLPQSRGRRKFDRDDIDEDMVDTTQGVTEWWWYYLNVLRENTLVIFANICAQLRLDVFPNEICLPILDGLLHWVVCPSSCASDPLPTVGPISVLSPLRLVLEALCKLCIHDENVDMLLATPSYERIVQLFSVLTKLLANKNEQVTMEFAIVLLSQLVKGGSSAARGIALQHPCISLLIDFVETAEQKAVQFANMHDVQMLRDSPETMRTSLDMLQRAATVLLYLSKVPENYKLFVHHQSRILSLVMSQILDNTVTSLLSDVLFQCSQLS